jgi:hypothetical protein
MALQNACAMPSARAAHLVEIAVSTTPRRDRIVTVIAIFEHGRACAGAAQIG